MSLGLLKRINCEKMDIQRNWTWLEYYLGGWNVGEQVQASQQRLGLKVVERLQCVHECEQAMYKKC